MIKRLRYILMLAILFSSAIQAQAQIPLPEKVCIGTVRRYWVDGMAGSTYTWKINGVFHNSITNQIDITWVNAGIFTLEVQEHQDNCVGDLQSGVVEVLDLITPTFDPIASVCSGAPAITLPTTSLNGIKGIWTPGFNNTATTEYTFTPTVGQCATTVRLTINIGTSITPIFAAVGPYCVGATIAALPTLSINGIIGTWSPAIINTSVAGLGTYTFTPKTCQCGVSIVLKIETVEPIIITDTHLNIDNNHAFGSIDLTVSGGTGSGTYIYSWNNGATSEDLTNLAIGTYNVVVTDKNGCQSSLTIKILNETNQAPIATNDEFITSCSILKGDLLYTDNGHGTDHDPEGDPFFIEKTSITLPHGYLTINADGSFAYQTEPGHIGDVSFKYRIFDVKKNYSIPAAVIIHVISDMDHDGIPDSEDPDADGDGILNIYEVLPGQDWRTTDTDGDGIPNYLDIDSDGDGIPDNIEAQSIAHYIRSSNLDVNHNGVDDAYDLSQSGYEIHPIDTNGDGIPDFLDLDSDNDKVPDYIEGHDANHDGKPDHVAIGRDSDGDGLDDGYDTVVNDCNTLGNATGSNAAMQDTDGDGKPDWRDDNDDNDAYLTVYEDLNGDGDYSNDDSNNNGIPDYLDPAGRDCDLFIPEAFSPNGDNIHDYYQIYCINHYPNARIYIFDQLGNKIFDKAHYGNLDVWKSYEKAWWCGKPDRGPANAINELVAPGTYYYVLDLGNGEVKKSFVYVSY